MDTKLSTNTPPKWVGHVAALTVYIIFGINPNCSKAIIPQYIHPEVFTEVRMLFGAAGFWLLSLFFTREKVERKDMGLFVFGAFVLAGTLIAFAEAFRYTSPCYVSLISATSPLVVMILAAIFLKEPITWKKVLGVATSFGGILWLILQSTTGATGPSETQPLGIVFCFANYIVFALYLGTCRNLIARYSVITSMKWMFLASFIVAIPFAMPYLPQTDFAAVPGKVWWEIGYMIFFSTFLAYYLIPIGQQRIRPTLVSMYGYLQPIIAIAVAIWAGMDRLTITKVVAALLVFTGVWVVNKSRAAAN